MNNKQLLTLIKNYYKDVQIKNYDTYRYTDMCYDFLINEEETDVDYRIQILIENNVMIEGETIIKLYKTDYYDIIKSLINSNIKFHYYTIISLCEKECYDILLLLLESNKISNIFNVYTDALCEILKKCNIDIFLTLFNYTNNHNYSIDIKKIIKSAIYYHNVNNNNNIEIIKLLLLYVSNISDILACSASCGHIDIIRFLLDNYNNKFDINELNNALTLSSYNDNVDIVKLLLEYGADVHTENEYSLRNASSCGNTRIVKLLLEYGANVHAVYNKSIIDATINNHKEVVLLLLKYGADIHESDYAHSAFENAAYTGNIDILQIFIDHEYNNNNNNFNYNLNNILKFACYQGYIDCVKLLLKYGADISFDNYIGLMWTIDSLTDKKYKWIPKRNQIDVIKLFIIKLIDDNDYYKDADDIIKYTLNKIPNLFEEEIKNRHTLDTLNNDYDNNGFYIFHEMNKYYNYIPVLSDRVMNKILFTNNLN